MQKSLIAISAIAALIGSPALAADLLLKAPSPPPPAASWTGCYVDAGGGYGFWNQDHNLSFTPPVAGLTSTATTTDGGRGWLGRFGGGCDYQAPLFNNRIVIGAFADYDPMGLNGSNSASEVFAFGAPAGTTPITANEKETGAWYVGGRVGYLVNPSFLTYFDGGYTQTHFTQTGEFSTLSGAPIAFGYPNFSTSGWFLGGGYEYALSDLIPIPGLFLQTEYRFSQYSSRTLTEVSLTTGAPTGNQEITKPYVQTVTTALVWRFNWNGLR
jgi:outer membrane immunogenic protein